MSTEAVQTQKREKLVLFHLKINKIVQEFKAQVIKNLFSKFQVHIQIQVN